MFFDLGGGTLAIVYAEDFKVKKVMCLPLGARRLTYLYGNPKKGGLFVKKDYERMKGHILELLPTRSELRLAKKTRLVGVGGTVRALASFHADKSKYPFEKLHNYVMDYDEVAWTTSQFFRMKRRQMKVLALNGPDQGGDDGRRLMRDKAPDEVARHHPARLEHPRPPRGDALALPP